METPDAGGSKLKIYFSGVSHDKMDTIVTDISGKIGKIITSIVSPDQLTLFFPVGTEVVFGGVNQNDDSIILDFITPTRAESVVIGTTSRVRYVVLGNHVLYPLGIGDLSLGDPNPDGSLWKGIVGFIKRLYQRISS